MKPLHALKFAIATGITLAEAQHSGRLATTGPFERARHPQYAAFVLIMLGFLVQWPTLVTLAMFPILVIMCVLLARREDAEAAAAFGDAWRAYAARTPRFFPRINPIESRSPA